MQNIIKHFKPVNDIENKQEILDTLSNLLDTAFKGNDIVKYIDLSVLYKYSPCAYENLKSFTLEQTIDHTDLSITNHSSGKYLVYPRYFEREHPNVGAHEICDGKLRSAYNVVRNKKTIYNIQEENENIKMCIQSEAEKFSEYLNYAKQCSFEPIYTRPVGWQIEYIKKYKKFREEMIENKNIEKLLNNCENVDDKFRVFFDYIKSVQSKLKDLSRGSQYSEMLGTRSMGEGDLYKALNALACQRIVNFNKELNK
jgi:hypothetical protein